jgi:hypothetical protein
MKKLALVLILAIAAQGALVSFADAGPRGGGGGGSRGGGGGGGARPAPSRPAPSQPASSGRQGFNVPTSDYKKPNNPPPNRNNANNANNANRNNANNNANRNNANNNANRNNANNNGNRNNANNNGNRNNVNNNGNRNNVNNNGNRTTVNNNGNRTNINNNNVNINRTVINNPVYYGGGAWGWNRGVAWAPAYGYYGGGFWGALAIGVTSAAVYGAIVSSNNQTYTSYQVQPSSPGATLLANYQLQQVQCGPPNLVVIYGPDNSVICAYPNNLVAAGNYNLNTETLSLSNQ